MKLFSLRKQVASSGGPIERSLIVGIVVMAMFSMIGGSCVEEAEPLDPSRLSSFDVDLVDTTNLGVPPYEFLSDFESVTMSVRALTPDGRVKTDYNGTLQVHIVPGEVAEDSRFIKLTNGVNESFQVRFRYSFGNARVWVEEVGLGEIDECHDGFDNDGDGGIDYPGDTGCFGPDDPSETTASYITGLSNALPFGALDVRAIQYNVDDPSGESPLLNAAVVIEDGNLIVTNVVLNGFFVTDVDETEGYDSIFIFNFSFPDGVRVGDKMSWIAGGVSEFQQGTQLTFPTWEHDDSYEIFDEDRIAMSRCEPVDNPAVSEITPSLLPATTLGDFDALETYESSLIRIENAQISNRFLHCDWDVDGEISGPNEEACRDECQNDIMCTELSNYWRRDQFNIVVDGAQAQFSGAWSLLQYDPTQDCEVIREEDPHELSCPDRTLAHLTGTLRHVFLTSRIQLWEIVPRYNCDVAFACETDDDCPMDLLCGEGLCQDPFDF